ncbi:MAG: beta-class carbonic anhydrase [Oscillospiraceae bacterium]|jgi:carbonic anhydrase
MTAVEEMLAFNEKFVSEKRYLPYQTDKYPAKKIAVLTCMDTRLVTLLPAALDIQNGDVKMIKNAGAVVTEPYGETLRSLLVGILELGVEELMVIGHTDCGAAALSGEKMTAALLARGISRDAIASARECADFDKWFRGFDSVETSVADTVSMLRAHPLIPKDVDVHGYVMDAVTGKLTPLSD